MIKDRGLVRPDFSTQTTKVGDYQITSIRLGRGQKMQINPQAVGRVCQEVRVPTDKPVRIIVDTRLMRITKLVIL